MAIIMNDANSVIRNIRLGDYLRFDRADKDFSNEDRSEIARKLREIKPSKAGYIEWWKIAQALGIKELDNCFGWEKFKCESVSSLADIIDSEQVSSSGHNINEFKVGDVVWHKDGMGPFVVEVYDSQYDYVFCREATAKYGVYRSYVLTKEKPKTYFGKDNLPVQKNDRVWDDSVIIGYYNGPFIVDRITKNFVIFTDGSSSKLKNIVHHIPDDSWDKIIDDACSMTPKEYCEKYKIFVKSSDYAEKKIYDLKNRINILIKRYEEEME